MVTKNVKAAVDKARKDVAGSRGGSIFGEYEDKDGNIDFEAIARFLLSTSGGFEFFVIAQWTKQGEIDGYLGGLVQELVHRLWGITLQANYDEGTPENIRAHLQLKAIEKITYPEKYNLPEKDIKRLVATRHTRPSIARAMELRAIMSNLAWVVSPANGNNGGVNKTGVNKTIKLKPVPPSKHWEETYKLAVKHWRRGTTLQALAIRVYLAQLQDEGVLGEDEKGINEGRLKKDLAEAEKWEAAHLDLPNWQALSLGNEPIRVFEVSHEWKDRMRRKRLKIDGCKGGQKKSKNLHR